MFRILVVDDERRILNGIRMIILEELKFSFEVDVVVASNVPQALDTLVYFQPDLLLTDIRMPVMDGFVLIQQVKERYPSISVAILTSHADFEYAQRAIKLQVTAFILKPIDQQALRELIEDVYRKKSEKQKNLERSVVEEIRSMMLYDFSEQELSDDEEVI